MVKAFALFEMTLWSNSCLGTGRSFLQLFEQKKQKITPSGYFILLFLFYFIFANFINFIHCLMQSPNQNGLYGALLEFPFEIRVWMTVVSNSSREKGRNE